MKNLIKFKINKTEEDIKIDSMKSPDILYLNNNEQFVNSNNKMFIFTHCYI